VTLSGTSKDMEDQARAMSDEQLTEIAYSNVLAPSLKARAELSRRQSVSGGKTLFWARFAGWTGLAALILALIVAFLQFK